MDIEQIYNIEDPNNYIMHADAEIVSGKAIPKLVDNAGLNFTQDYSSPAGFIVDDPTKAEIAGGQAQQKNQLIPGIMCAATYTADKDLLAYSLGNKTGNLFGNASVSGGKLDLTGYILGTHAKYNAVSNGNPVQKGCIHIKFRTNYYGTPTEDQQIYSSGKLLKNEIQIYQWHGDGTTYVRMRDKNTAQIFLMGGGIFSPIAGELNEWELNFDIDAGGTTRFFINGEIKATSNLTGDRDNDSTDIYLGRFVSAGNAQPNIFIEEWFVSSEIQHTANYTPGWMIPENRYVETFIDEPDGVYSGPGSIQSYNSLASTESGAPRFVINGKYWTGTEFLASDKSYSKSSPMSDFEANKLLLTPCSPTTKTITFPNSNILNLVSNSVINYTGQLYSQSDPWIRPKDYLNMKDVSKFLATIIKAGSDNIGLIQVVNNIRRYYTDGAWANSDGTLAQSNIDISILTEAVMKELIEPDVGSEYYWLAILHSGDGLTYPGLDQIIIGGDKYHPEDSDIPECKIFFHAEELLGVNYSDAQLVVKSYDSFWHGKRFILPFIRKSEIDINNPGYIKLSVIETYTISKTLRFYVEYTDPNDNIKKQAIFKEAIVPNQEEINGKDLLTLA